MKLYSHYSEHEILFPFLRKLNTGTGNQIENVKYSKLGKIESK